MNVRVLRTVLVLLFLVRASIGLGAEPVTPEGKRILQNKSFDDTDKARQEILKVFKNLRVPDVSDGMDAIGLQDIGAMDRSIRPLWRDTERFSHRFVGFAVTVRYLPAQLRMGQNSFTNYAEYNKFKRAQYKQSGEKHWISLGRRGDAVVVFDAEDVGYVGFIGSNNSLKWAKAGFVGIVTDGNSRDTDEIIKQAAIPVYSRKIGGGVRPGRIWLDSVNVPINCGGALVFPGDVIVGDGDGVIVVPRQHALRVGKIARGISDGDKKGRFGHYKDLGIPLDDTVRPFDVDSEEE